MVHLPNNTSNSHRQILNEHALVNLEKTIISTPNRRHFSQEKAQELRVHHRDQPGQPQLQGGRPRLSDGNLSVMCVWVVGSSPASGIFYIFIVLLVGYIAFVLFFLLFALDGVVCSKSYLNPRNYGRIPCLRRRRRVSTRVGRAVY